MAINYTVMQAKATRQIRRFGTTVRITPRTGAARSASGVVTQYSANERAALTDPNVQRMLVVASIDPPPDRETDKFAELLSRDGSTVVAKYLILAAKPLRPGDTILYWDLQVKEATNVA